MSGAREVPAGMTPFQAEVAYAFSQLAEASEFRLAGGSALLAQQLSERMSHDLDLFTARGTVDEARRAFAADAAGRGWSFDVLRASPTFCQVAVGNEAGEEVLVDLAVNGASILGPVPTAVGPTFAPEELAGQKTLALFNRAAARDYVDVYTLALRFGTELLLRRARELDAGFNVPVLVDMIVGLDRFRDEDIPIEDPDAVRSFFRAWVVELRG